MDVLMSVENIEKELELLVKDTENIVELEDALRIIARLSDILDELLPLARTAEYIGSPQMLLNQGDLVMWVNEIIRNSYRKEKAKFYGRSW
jgi:hypothetical protein